MNGPDPAKIRKIFFPMNMGIGDIIMFIPTLRSFKRYFNNSVITVATRDRYMPLLRGIVDEFITFNGLDTTPKQRLSFLFEIRERHFDMVVKPYLGSTHIIIALSGIPNRVGYASCRDFPVPLDFIFNYRAVFDSNEHQIDRNLALFRAAGGTKPVRDLDINIEEKERLWAKEILRVNGVKEGDLKVAIGPETAAEWKEWGIANFDEVAGRLIERKDAKVVIVGLRKRIGRFRNQVVDLCNKTTLIEALAILKECHLSITNDGGVMWMSSAVGTPVIALYGPTDHIRTGPPNTKDVFIRKDLDCSPCYVSRSGYRKAKNCNDRRCLKLITPDDVVKLAMRKLG